MEVIGVFTETVDVGICGQDGLDTEILGFVDQCMLGSGEQNFLGGSTEDREGEGLCGVVELDGSRLRCDIA